MRSIRVMLVVAVLASPAGARADAVGACPPGFDPSHSGCHFSPDVEDLGVVACCVASIGALVAGALALGWVSRRRRGPREP